ncbi:hypothetical protein [Ancylobacter moscoviensis]
MRKTPVFGLAVALAGWSILPASAQRPTYQYLGLREQVIQEPREPQVSTGWMNVCRERPVIRQGWRGQPVQVQVPMCNMVWVGKRYFHNGNYYADPNFMTPLN